MLNCRQIKSFSSLQDLSQTTEGGFILSSLRNRFDVTASVVALYNTALSSREWCRLLQCKYFFLACHLPGLALFPAHDIIL